MRDYAGPAVSTDVGGHTISAAAIARRYRVLWTTIAAWLTAGGLYHAGNVFITWDLANWDKFETRLALVFTNGVFATLPLLLMIMTVAAQRLGARELNESFLRPSPQIEINRRILINTSEQLLLYFVAHLGLVVFSRPEAAKAMVLLTALFVIGRLLFWVGYHYNRYLRIFGFALTFYPIVAVYIVLLIRMVNRAFGG